MKTSPSIGALLALTLAVAGAQAQDLHVRNGLQLWLKADAGVTVTDGVGVTTWADQSGLGHDAVQFDPTSAPALVPDAIEGRPAIRFDGADDYLDVMPTQELVIEGDISSWFVVKMDDFATFRSVWAKTSGNLPAPTDFYVLPGTGIPRVYRGNGTLESLGNIDAARPLVAGTFMVVGFEMSGTTLTHYLNGQPNGSGSITAELVDLWTALKIGTRDDFVTRLKGDLAELMIYNRALTDVERGEVNGYLKARYGLENDPPLAAIAAPAGGASFEVPAAFTVEVNASDADGQVVAVRLFANGSLVGTATAPPYRFPLSVRTPGEVLLVAVAEDNAGATGESDPVSVSVTGGDEVALTALDNLQLWLRADAGVTRAPGGGVTLWEDQSGNGHHAVATGEASAPAWVEEADTGRPALRFDGVEDYLEVASAPGIEITGDIASFFVVRFDDHATFRAVWGKTDSNVPRSTDYYLLPGSGLPRLYRGSPDGIAEVTGASGVPAGVYALVGFNMAGNQVTHFLNGQPNGSGALNAPLADVGTPLRIGTRGDFVTRMKGDIAELLIYDVALDAEGIEAVMVYLASKYGPALVGLANQPPQVVLMTPQAGTVAAPVTLPITATATDADGAVVEVSYFANGQLLGRTTQPPHQQGIRIETAGTVVLTASARDNLGAVRSSEPVTLTVTGEASGDLDVTGGLQLWLRGDAGIATAAGAPVTGWSDQSGRGNDAFQFNPPNAPMLVADAIAGRPAVRFDGTDSFLTVNTAPGLELVGDLTSLFVVRVDDFATFRAVWSKTLENQPRPIDYYLNAGNGVPVVLRGGSEGNAAVAASGPVPAGVPVVLGFSQAGSTLTHHYNGRPFGSGPINIVPEDFFMPLTIGTRDDFATRLRGDLAELLIYDRALSEDELGQVAQYLGGRYGVAIFQPVTIETVDAPTLSVEWVGEQLVISWTAPEGAHSLEAAGELSPGAWDGADATVVHQDGVNRATLSPTAGILFIRLRQN